MLRSSSDVIVIIELVLLEYGDKWACELKWLNKKIFFFSEWNQNIHLNFVYC